jgi:hypothetical protein
LKRLTSQRKKHIYPNQRVKQAAETEAITVQGGKREIKQKRERKRERQNCRMGHTPKGPSRSLPLTEVLQTNLFCSSLNPRSYSSEALPIGLMFVWHHGTATRVVQSLDPFYTIGKQLGCQDSQLSLTLPPPSPP